jgi:hypothetical protein
MASRSQIFPRAVLTRFAPRFIFADELIVEQMLRLRVERSINRHDVADRNH